MPVNVSNLTDEARTLEIDVQGEKLTVVYNVTKITGEAEAELEAATDKELQGRSASVFLAEVLNSWDLIDDDKGSVTGVAGGPVGTDYDTLVKLPIVFLGKVISELQDDTKPESGQGNA